MLQQIRQVVVTYTSHRYALWISLAVVALVITPNLLGSTHGNRAQADRAQPMTMIVGMPLFFLVPFLVGHVKTQFAHSRARLMPDFLPAHLIVLAGVLLFVLVVYPYSVATYCGLEPLGLVALATSIAAPAVWGAHRSRMLWMFVSLGVFYSLLTNWGLHWWILDAEQHRGALLLTFVVGTGSLVAWLWRLCYLHEEADDYERTMQWNASRRSGTEVVEQRRIVAVQVQRNRLTSWINDVWMSDIGHYYGGGQAGLVRLLRYGVSAQPVEVHSLFMALMLLAISFFLTDVSYLRQGEGPGSLWFLIQMSLMLPGAWAGQWFVLRRPRMAMELLRAVGRTQYFDGLFAAAAWNTGIAWLAINAALSIPLLRMMHGQVVFSVAITFILLSVATTCATFGLAIRTAVWKSTALRLGVLMVGWFVLIVPTVAWWTAREKFGDLPFVLGAIILAAMGVGLALEARRAWLNLEFG